MSILLIKKGSHKWYATLTALVVFWGFRMLVLQDDHMLLGFTDTHTHTKTHTHTQAHANRYTYIKPFDNVVHVKMVWKHVFIKTISIWRYLYRSFVIYWLWGRGDRICILIIVRGLYYGTGISIVNLLSERIWGKSLHILI